MQQSELNLPVRFDELWAIVKAQRWTVAMVTLPVVVLALVGSLLVTKEYRAIAVLQISAAGGQEVDVENVVNSELHYLRNITLFYRTQIDILRSRLILQEVARRFNELTPEAEVTAGALGTQLTVKPLTNSELVEIHILDSDPEHAAMLANLVGEVYREFNLEARRDSAREARTWLEAKIGEYEVTTRETNQALLDYQSANDLADVEEDVTELSARMEALNLELGRVSTDRVLLETTLASHRSLLKRQAYEELAKDLDSRLLEALTESYATTVSEHTRVAARYGEKHPDHQRSLSRLQRIEEEVRSEVGRSIEAEKVQVDLLLAKERDLQVAIDRAKEQLLERQALGSEYAVLVRNYTRAQEFYALLSKRYDELHLQSQTQLNNVRVIDPAVAPLRPAKPNVLLNLAIGLFSGLLAGVGLVLLREQIDDSISTPFDVETYLKVPYLGMVPALSPDLEPSVRALYTHQHPRSSSAESMRAIRTFLLMRPEGAEMRRFLVTSAVAADGKTESAVRLAVSFASLGKRVLILDADLRRPRMHAVFGVERTPGVSTWLRGEGGGPSSCVPTSVPGVDLLPSGPSVEHPNELLGSLRLQRVLEELGQIYDLVIIDTPPVGIVADALVLSPFVDGVVMVAREGAVSRGMVRSALGRLQQVGANVLGVVVNAVNLTQATGRYGYYNRYGYGYGYGYGHSKYYETKDETAA